MRAVVRESGVQIYSIGIFDPYAATTEERLGPLLLNDISDRQAARLFRVDDVAEMGDIATKSALNCATNTNGLQAGRTTKHAASHINRSLGSCLRQGCRSSQSMHRTGYCSSL